MGEPEERAPKPFVPENAKELWLGSFRATVRSRTYLGKSEGNPEYRPTNLLRTDLLLQINAPVDKSGYVLLRDVRVYYSLKKETDAGWTNVKAHPSTYKPLKYTVSNDLSWSLGITGTPAPPWASAVAQVGGAHHTTVDQTEWDPTPSFQGDREVVLFKEVDHNFNKLAFEEELSFEHMWDTNEAPADNADCFLLNLRVELWEERTWLRHTRGPRSLHTRIGHAFSQPVRKLVGRYHYGSVGNLSLELDVNLRPAPDNGPLVSRYLLM